jgi:hypothetical protein
VATLVRSGSVSGSTIPGAARAIAVHARRRGFLYRVVLYHQDQAAAA